MDRINNNKNDLHDKLLNVSLFYGRKISLVFHQPKYKICIDVRL